MQKAELHVLSTRPLGAALLHQAALNDIRIHESSFIQTIPVNDSAVQATIGDLLQKRITAVFTSMNGVDAVSKYVKADPGWIIYCIGNTTKNRVHRSFGGHSVAGSADNAEQLAILIVNDNVKEVVFFCGNQRREQLPSILNRHGIKIKEVIVYNTLETPEAVEGDYDGILFFSPSAVKSFFSINRLSRKTQVFAIGSTTAAAIRQYSENDIIISASPGKEDLVLQMIDHFSSFKSNYSVP